MARLPRAWLAAGAATAVTLLTAYLARRRRRGELQAKKAASMQRSGVVESIWTCPLTSRAMLEQTAVECVAGRGIVGDRYSIDLAAGRYSCTPEPGRQLTLIAAEGMDHIRRTHGLDIGPRNCRRNVVVRGLHPLSELVGREFLLGNVRVFAHRATVPCMYLEGLTKQKGLFQELYCDAGLSCEILEGGPLAAGDTAELIPGEASFSRCVVGAAWKCEALFVRPRERTSLQRRQVIELRRSLEAAQSAEEDPEKAGVLKKKLRLFDQTHGRKNQSWDGGSPQY